MLDISEQVRYAAYLRDKTLMPLTNRLRKLSLDETTHSPFSFEYESGKYESLMVDGQLLGSITQCPVCQAQILENTGAISFNRNN